jgi:uncharacterized protein (DUF2132 family)
MLNFVQRFQKMDENLEHNNQVNNPLHGIKLADILEYLVLHLGWEKMASLVVDASIKVKLATRPRRIESARSKDPS